MDGGKKRKWEFPSGLDSAFTALTWVESLVRKPNPQAELKRKKKLNLNNAEWVLLPCSEIICLNKTYCTITPKKVLQNNLLCPVNNATKFATLVTKCLLYVPISILGALLFSSKTYSNFSNTEIKVVYSNKSKIVYTMLLYFTSIFTLTFINFNKLKQKMNWHCSLCNQRTIRKAANFHGKDEWQRKGKTSGLQEWKTEEIYVPEGCRPVCRV